MSDQGRCPTGWVSVEDRTPTEEGWYLTFDRYETIQTMFYGKSISQRDGFTIMGELQDVTHWMPLPSAPSSVAEQPQPAKLGPPEAITCDKWTYCPNCGAYCTIGPATGHCYNCKADYSRYSPVAEQPSREQADKACVCEPGSPCKRHGREQAVEGLVEAAKAVMSGLDHYCDYPDHNEPYEGDDCPHEFIGLAKCESLRKALAHYEASRGERQ